MDMLELLTSISKQLKMKLDGSKLIETITTDIYA